MKKKAKKKFAKKPKKKTAARKKAAKKKTVRAKVKAKKKPAAKKKKRLAKAKPKPAVIAPPNSRLLGRVEDYFAKIGVVALTLQSPVEIGARLHVLGHTTNFEQTLDSMQIEHEAVTSAKAKDGVGIKVTTRARSGDYVYLILS
jgi:hypothetical protein